MLLPPEKEMYEAFIRKDPEYEGVFVVGVKTTGIFCKATCPARKPKFTNVEFFADVNQAINAGYRPCKRCKPLKLSKTPDWAQKILDEIDSSPSKKWADQELKKRGVHPNKIRRWFKKNYGVTFHEYVRHCRVGSGMASIRDGESLTQAAFDINYDSISGFRNAVKKLTSKSAKKGSQIPNLYLNKIHTPLGPILMGATNDFLCLLKFIDSKAFDKQLKKISYSIEHNFLWGSTSIIEETSDQIKQYFEGKIKKFSIPIELFGTPFQKKVWQQVQEIQYGKTTSYAKVAKELKEKNATRAVANAIAKNQIYLITPCHRVIGSNGNLSGYGGEVWRKRYLLTLEKS